MSVEQFVNLPEIAFLLAQGIVSQESFATFLQEHVDPQQPDRLAFKHFLGLKKLLLTCRLWYLSQQNSQSFDESQTSDGCSPDQIYFRSEEPVRLSVLSSPQTDSEPSSQPTFQPVGEEELSFDDQLRFLFDQYRGSHQGVPVQKFLEPKIIAELADAGKVSRDEVLSVLRSMGLSESAIMTFSQFQSFVELLSQKIDDASASASSAPTPGLPTQMNNLGRTANDSVVDRLFADNSPQAEQESAEFVEDLVKSLFKTMQRQVSFSWSLASIFS
jgi:hypothetical protein